MSTLKKQHQPPIIAASDDQQQVIIPFNVLQYEGQYTDEALTPCQQGLNTWVKALQCELIISNRLNLVRNNLTQQMPN